MLSTELCFKKCPVIQVKLTEGYEKMVKKQRGRPKAALRKAKEVKVVLSFDEEQIAVIDRAVAGLGDNRAGWGRRTLFLVARRLGEGITIEEAYAAARKALGLPPPEDAAALEKKQKK